MKTYPLFTLLTILIFSLSSCYAQSIPPAGNIISVPGLQDTVTVRRDGRSIPYIEAKNDADLYFAQGFETARDRLWQMDLYRRVARGRLAELFGKTVLNEDIRWRKFGFSEIAEESLRVLNPELRKALEDYTRGVNAYIATLDKNTMPVEFQILQYQPEPWKPTDTIVIGKILADGLSTTWWQDLNLAELQKLPKKKYEALTDVTTPADLVLYGSDSRKTKRQVATADLLSNDPGLNEFVVKSIETRKASLERIGFYAKGLAASNNWVISGKRTADGKAILANDPHLQASAPGIWYLTHLSAPGVRVSGVTFPGVPGIVLGHNESIAWGATNVGPDVQDVYIEEFNISGEYKTPEGWMKPVVRNEEIRFRPNLLSPKTETEYFEVVETRNGVIIRESEGKQFALKWTARVPENQEFEAFFQLNRAKDWNDFKKSLSSYGGAAQNFVFADSKGNIGWQVAGKIPVRRKGDGALPYRGAAADGDWIGNIPFEELPHIYNPSEGFIITANQRIAGTNYKYQQITRQIAAPWRARRIFDLIKPDHKMTVERVGAIQHDSFNIPLSAFAREIVKRNAASVEILAILRDWDGKMTADSIGATIANEINGCIGGEIAAANRPASSWHIRQVILPWAIPNNDRLWLPKKYLNWTEFLKACEVKSVASLAKSKGLSGETSTWKWGVSRGASFSHPLAAAPLIGGQFMANFPNVDGSGQTPNVGANVSMRFITKAGGWDETRQVVPLGQSGDPKSAHWKDQFESWRTGNSPVFPFSKTAVENAATGVVVLVPTSAETRTQ